MRVKSPGTREVLELSTGHMPTTSDEAMEAYLLITSRIWRHLFREDVEIRKPSATAAIRLRNAEWGRTPKHSLKDQADYWEKYLLGQGHLEVGFDVMAETEEHQQFMRQQIECLAIRRGESVGRLRQWHRALSSIAIESGSDAAAVSGIGATPSQDLQRGFRRSCAGKIQSAGFPSGGTTWCSRDELHFSAGEFGGQPVQAYMALPERPLLQCGEAQGQD